MNRVFLLSLIIAAISFSAMAQTANKSKVAALPINILKMNGKDSLDLLNNPTIKARLRNLLGKKNYADFLESWETSNPVVKKGNFLFSSGCLIHACGHIESAIAVDLVNKSIHVGIFREQEKTRFFNESGRKTPAVIKNWASRLLQK